MMRMKNAKAVSKPGVISMSVVLDAEVGVVRVHDDSALFVEAGQHLDAVKVGVEYPLVAELVDEGFAQEGVCDDMDCFHNENSS